MRLTTETRRNVRATLAAIDEHYPATGRGSLLTLENPKTLKDSSAYLTAVMHLAPASSSGANVCAWSVKTCVTGCLTYAGRGGIQLDGSNWNKIQAARIRRTARMLLHPDTFTYDLLTEIATLKRRADRDGRTLAVRLNGTSDIAWHKTNADLVDAIRKMGVTMYEYTKRPTPAGYTDAGIDITYSYPGGEGVAARRFLEAGHRVAVVFAGKTLPAEWVAPWGDALPVIDGDKHDHRFLEPGGVVVGLRAKGRLRGATGSRLGFVQVA